MTNPQRTALPSVLMVAVCYAVAAVPFQDYLMIGGISHSQLATAGLAVAGILFWLLNRPFPLPTDTTLPHRIGVLAALALATGYSAYGWSAGVDELRRWGIALAVGALVAVVPRSSADLRLLILVLCVAPAAAALYALVQSLRGVGPAAFLIAGTPFTRANGTIGQPNSFAGYINGAWPALVALALWGRQRAARWRWPVYAVVVLLLSVLVLSFSRGGWFGAACGTLVMLWVAGGRWRIGAVVVVLLGVVVVSGGWRLIPGPFGARLGSAAQVFSAPLILRDEAQQRPAVYAAVERAMQFQAGLAMFLRAPLTGVGPGNYTRAYPDVAYNGWWISRGHAHNGYVQVAAEQGVIGLIAYLWLWLASFRRAYRLDRTVPVLRFAAMGLCGTAAAIAGHECFEYLQVNYLPVHVAAVLGIAGALPRLLAAEEVV